ncbi:hypothetical protein ACFPRL_15495 [Pseudoclavibacter helvolus]
MPAAEAGNPRASRCRRRHTRTRAPRAAGRATHPQRARSGAIRQASIRGTRGRDRGHRSGVRAASSCSRSIERSTAGPCSAAHRRARRYRHLTTSCAARSTG